MACISQESDFTGWGCYHYCGDETVSWYEFADFIIANAKEQSLVKSLVEISPIPSSEYPTLAHRPAFSALDCQKINDLGVASSNWKSAVKALLSHSAN